MILTIRTDKPDAELGLFDKDGTEISYVIWPAHRELSETIHAKLQSLLSEKKLAIKDLSGIVYYEGPGSYTGLRIGAAVSNALATGLNIPVVSYGDTVWQKEGIEQIRKGISRGAVPFYEEDAKTTVQKK